MLKDILEDIGGTLKKMGLSKEAISQPVCVQQAGVRQGHEISQKLVQSVREYWFSQNGAEADAVNSVLIMTMAKNGSESLVTFAFNPHTGVSEASLPEMEADAYLLALDYLKGACSNRIHNDGRVRFAMDRLQKMKNGSEIAQ
ncbi:hypothetical protein [Acidithiobacillus caldus]|uniref:Uncharacterized protein n=1 Tax=Acidithiobacillus caldus TaxID=33059 RepID=A0A1E7YMY1_9PROT|nr:hypothetical protein [Acidithiobacillus caldus]OFC35996.1 hypothetical protein BAE27_06800 [Acidithiobacillus caldus]OFC38358.1 hypothetical protein BAE28_05770 [Acidithiobacillus caldus]OFC40386.1 hypothetical protein BAE29_05385 [Acidithiobacillus caldus]OFC58622.1 hypothetical protein BAE30_08975 [Acidithiobacillus caldus]